MRLLMHSILALGLALAVAVPVQAAGLSGDQVGVQLDLPGGISGDPTPLNFSDLVLVGAGAEIAAGDGTNIGGFMLSNAQAISEFVDIGEFTINLRLLSGDPNDESLLGFGAGARYLFEDLDIVDKIILGGTLTSLGGISNFSASWLSFNGSDGFELAIDSIALSDRGQGIGRYGDLQISLITRDRDPTNPVPAPASLLLAASALLVCRGLRR